MEMIDVLSKLKEIAESKPDLVADAVANVQATNPQAVVQNAVQSEPALKTDEAGMSDVHIGAQEALGEFQDEDGNLKGPKAQVVAALTQKAKTMPFPDSYEYEMAAKMAADDFDDAGERNPDMDMSSEQPADEGNAFAQAVQQAKASGMKKGDKFKVGDEEHTLRDSDFEGESTIDMKTEKTEGKIPAGLKAYQDKKAGKEEKKETVKEAIQISADSPQEASMMMQILKLAGVKPVDDAMIGAEPEHDHEHTHGDDNEGCGPSCAEHGCDCEHGRAGQDDAMGSQEMGRMRDMMTAPEEEKQEETFDNEPDVKVQNTDTLVNTMSGGMNRQKKTFPKVASGDNPMAAEDTVTEEDLANSLRAQYEGFKEAYQKEAKIAEAKPDFLDMDKDGDKKEPMKKAIKDKEAK
jgi:hypothetical protein